MKILVLGGTKFFGKHAVDTLLKSGHDITIATRGTTPVDFAGVRHLIVDRTNVESMKSAFKNQYFDVVIDSLAYCSNDVKNIFESASFGRYIMNSTGAVYNKHLDTKEEEFDPYSKELIWCGRFDFPYAEIKRNAEAAMFQQYSHAKPVAIRFPFGIGKDDYTKRLYFYIEHIILQKPMYIDNIDRQMSYVRSDEGGKFIASFVENDVMGTFNGSSEQTISLREICEYVEKKTGKKAVLSDNGDKAPYNGEVEYSLNVDKAKAIGFNFTPLYDWIYDLIDYHILEVTEQ